MIVPGQGWRVYALAVMLDGPLDPPEYIAEQVAESLTPVIFWDSEGEPWCCFEDEWRATPFQQYRERLSAHRDKYEEMHYELIPPDADLAATQARLVLRYTKAYERLSAKWDADHPEEK